MSVDLGDLVDSLKREVSPPGTDLFPNAVDDDYFGNLTDSFWEAKLDGLLNGYTELDGIVTPIAVGGADMGRDWQQLVVFYAGVRIVRNHLRSMNTVFRAVAGPVEFETQTSGMMLIALLKELQEKRNIILVRLSDIGTVPSYYIDAIIARDESIAFGDTTWVSESVHGYGNYGSSSYTNSLEY